MTRQAPITFRRHNEARTLAAAARDSAIAATLLGGAGLTDGQVVLALTRAVHPDWSWAQIGAHLGLSKDQAVARFRRMAQMAGLR